MLDPLPDPAPHARILVDNACAVDVYFGGEVTEEEIAWMLRFRTLHPSPDFSRLTLDYSERQAKLMRHGFECSGAGHLLGVLNWAGVGSRWEAFLRFVNGYSQDISAVNAVEAFAGFVRHLGRVTTYRALALSSSELEHIFDVDNIFPSGQLKNSERDVARAVSTHGACKVAVARLFIANLEQLIGFDPSVSLHDDWATAAVIASGYQDTGKPVYLFEVTVPMVATLGWRLVDVASLAPHFLDVGSANFAPWFSFDSPASPGGIWFDATAQRTERYVLYGVPFLRQRLRRLWVFRTAAEIRSAVMPFASQQVRLRSIKPCGQDLSLPVGVQ